MGKKLSLALLSVLISISLTSSVFAAGFALYETGARGNALGGAMVGRADDPSALYFNPAGITQLPGTQTLLGVTMIAPRLDVKTTGQIGFGVIPGPPPVVFPVLAPGPVTTTSMEDNYFFPPHAYLTQQVNDRIWVGLGVFSRFGLGVEFPQNWPGRYNSYDSNIVTSEANPNIAFKVSDNFSISAGVSLMYFDVTLKKKIPGQLFGGANEIDQELSGDSFGWGYNFGVHYKAADWMSIGAAYRSQVEQRVEGDLKLTGQVGPVQQALLPAKTNGKVTIDLPAQIFFGVAFKPVKKLSVEVGAILTEWSSYDQLKVKLDQPVAMRTVTIQEKNWRDAWRYHVGMEYNLTDWMDLRLSYIYDESPIPGETIGYELPDSDRQVFGIGLGFHKNNWNLDLSYNHLLFKDRDITGRALDFVLPSQVEDGFAYIAGVSLGYKF